MMSDEPGSDDGGRRRISRMDGEEGARAQFEMLLQRSLELIDQRFDFFCFQPGAGVSVRGGEGPLIEVRE